MSGFLGDLSPQQQAILDVFRKSLMLKGMLRARDDDITLLRFLRARQFDLEKAEAMFAAMLKFREENNVDTIRETFAFPEKDKVKQYYPHYHHKTDKQGRPMYFEQLGVLKLDELLKVTTLERMLLYHVQEWEVLIDTKFPACSKKAKTSINSSLTVLDLKGVSLKHMTKTVRAFIQKLARVDQDYYPEYLGKMMIINAPTSFKAIWALVKPFLDKHTLKKIEVHGSQFLPHLLKEADAESIPAFLGGSCCCEGRCQNSDAGPWRDPTYMVVEPLKAQQVT
ncbi:hypothetical protein KFL_001330015 [Klebsormidium nitens]|uniref:CRAL-TRIO domain-containing protein n=1 Tax=Klebsormidium nitens TaxID=105231 RepID=A0A0U9HJM7_KLENI|nr:hypothetical protein KFL_001330015 [Klebsormidium nitens]|eukprot:GAQ83019.1 hypothetical protein KFL_001330015 [Klebsormidium nitens]